MKIHNVLENPQIPNRNFWRYFSSHRQKHSRPIPPICGLGASVGWERFKRTFNTPRLKSQIGGIGLLCFVNFACYSSAANSLNFCFAFGDRFFGTCTSTVVYWSPCTEEFFMETIPFPRSLNLLPDCVPGFMLQRTLP